MKKFVFTLTGSGLLTLFASPVFVLAADDPDGSAELAGQSPIEIIITAGRKPQAVTDTLASTSVVTRDVLDKSQAQTLGEVLARLPGISLTNQGGTGKLTSVFLRGTNANHVLMLVDGVKVGSATAGLPRFEYLPVSQIERIEVVRGPRSSLYGSEAIGGVIQIFTRQGSKKGFTPRASVSYGSHNTRQADVSLSGGNGDSWYSFNAATERSDGFDARSTKYDFSSYQNIPDPETDDDGFSSRSLSLRAGHNFGNGVTTEVSVMNASGDNEFDGDFENENDFKQQVLSAKITAPVGKTTRLIAQLGQSVDEGDSFKDGVFTGNFDTTRNTLSVQAETEAGAHNFVYGVDFQQDEVDSNTAYAEDSRDNAGLFVSYERKLGANTLAASVRQDDNEQFGQHTTGSVALGHQLDNGIKLRASYGTAFKAPTFNDLYWPADSFFSGNADLQPEEANTAELGISGQLPQGRWAVNVFDTRVDNLISYVSDPVTFFGTMENVDEAKIQGVELELATQVADWRLSANATYQQTENLTGANKGRQLTRRPQKVLSLNADRRFGAFDLGATVHAEGARYMDAANTDRLGGFTTVDLRGRYQLNKDWAVAAKVGNLFDKEYETVRYYNQDGRNALLTLEYQPE